ncbi:HAD-IIB family hydrolase [Rubinisphaera sp.]|uniref:HAD-IIB family hydrolase n=1 Tax=Rubinisphaera sp. TaxID=2024857 RepID=UPI000C11D8AB|nr:HAD-IIB family hydrolase [Rubinisphaera sp.]MBV10040.1 mannosyl-3-phosphoglycerate phosphatase-related protein [Rubinisphaera sp.]HCS52725.1 mannosyl-3-phosphoglycerate phosphatase-related protein [Planctomycetaceae bacterium]|tara:strand:+ start:3248 stop:4033 length:786 start_codon:yes stop_codon:yes gene_type:complete
MPVPMIVFTDLDGCLLNHGDYSYQSALTVLKRLAELQIPLVLCSSKTEAEMRPLAEELDACPTIICENGGVVCWDDAGDRTVLGADRKTILAVLSDCKQQYQFSSFRDLGVEGIVRATGLSVEKATLAANRYCTEPLLWEDDETRIESFREELQKHQLQLTRGGRFWHVAGKTDKGRGAATAYQRMTEGCGESVTSVALGDSPIDQPMLEWANIAVIVPAPDGTIRLDFEHPSKIIAAFPGSKGWAEAMTRVLDDTISTEN